MSNALESIKARDEARKAAAASATAGLSPTNDDTFGESRKQLLARFTTEFERLAAEAKGYIDASTLGKAEEAIETMKKRLSESVTILSAYDIRTSQCTIDKLQEALCTARKALKPAKRFTFKSKHKRANVAQQPEQPPQQLTVKKEEKGEEEKWACDGFRDRKGETLAWYNKTATGAPKKEEEEEEEGTRKDFALCNLEGCTVTVEECFTALHISNLSECNVVVSPTNGSVWVDKCRGCDFTLGGHQVRIHETHDTTFRVIARSDPIIEDCTGLVFSPNTKASREDLSLCGIDPDNKEHAECWKHVKDFKWLSSDKQSPNWKPCAETETTETIETTEK